MIVIISPLAVIVLQGMFGGAKNATSVAPQAADGDGKQQLTARNTARSGGDSSRLASARSVVDDMLTRVRCCTDCR